jgi:uncharacterized lipoprotein
MKRILVLLVMGIVFIGCFPKVELTPEQKEKLHTRTVQKPKQEVWDTVIGFLHERNFSMAQENYEQGIILTDWRPINSEMAAVALSVIQSDLKAESKLNIQIRAVNENESQITMYMSGRSQSIMSGALNQPIDVPPQNYDMWFDMLGARMGVSFPHVCPE